MPQNIESYWPVGNPSQAVFGSSRAGVFLRDAAAFTDSVDIVTIGDSNAGSTASCGYTLGLTTACAYNGMPAYATPLLATSSGDGSNNRTGGMFMPLNHVRWVGTSGNMGTLTDAVAASNPQANALKTALNFNSNNLLNPNAFAWNASFVASGNTYTSPANGTSIRVLRPSPMVEGTGAGGNSCQYRVVHGVFATGSGQFKLLAMRGVNTIFAQSANFISTNTGTVGYATATLDFNSPTVSGAPVNFVCSYDGFNNPTASYQITGPFSGLWHSVIEKRKGFSVSNLVYYGGATVTQIADKIVDADNVVTSFLKELRQRQIEGGGTGRVIVWCNSGVNGPANGATWTTQMERIRDKFVEKWALLAFPPADLAFVMSVSHPQAPGATETTLQETRATANSWATGAGYGVCVVDISKLYSYSDLSNRRLYQSYLNAQATSHLHESIGGTLGSSIDRYEANYQYDMLVTNNGYFTVANAIMKQLLAFA